MSGTPKLPAVSGPGLPLDMWYLIIEAVVELKDKKTLKSLASVNSFFRGLAQAQLFRDVHFRHSITETISFIDVLYQPHILKNIRCVNMSAWGNAIDADIDWWTQSRSNAVWGFGEENILKIYEKKATEVKKAIQNLFTLCKESITTLRFGCGHRWSTRKTFERTDNFRWHAVDGRYLTAVNRRPSGRQLRFEWEPSYILFKSIAGDILVGNRFPRLEELSMCSKSFRILAERMEHKGEDWNPFWSIGWEDGGFTPYYDSDTRNSNPLPVTDKMGHLAENLEGLQKVSVMDTKTNNALNNRYWKPRQPYCSAQQGDNFAEEWGIKAAVRLISLYSHKLRSLDLQLHHWCELKTLSETMTELSSLKLGCIFLHESLSNVIAALPALKELDLDYLTIPMRLDSWANVFDRLSNIKRLTSCRFNGLGYTTDNYAGGLGLIAPPCCGHAKTTINEQLEEMGHSVLSPLIVSRGQYNPNRTYTNEGGYQSPPERARVAVCSSHKEDEDAFIRLYHKLAEDSRITVDDIPFWIFCFHDSMTALHEWEKEYCAWSRTPLASALGIEPVHPQLEALMYR